MTNSPEKPQKQMDNTRGPLTKLAFLVMSVVFVVGLVLNWMERRNAPASSSSDSFIQKVLRGSDPVDPVNAAEIFSSVAPRLYTDSFFGDSQNSDGYYVVVAGFMGGERHGDGLNENKTYRAMYPYLYDQQAPIFLDVTNENVQVDVIERAKTTRMSLKDALSQLTEHRPVVITFNFPTDATVELIRVKMELEQRNDDLRFKYNNEFPDLVIYSDYISSIELF